MKVLLFLTIFCAVSFASISPKYTLENRGGTKNWNITEVTAQSAPVKGQWNTVNVCAFANAPLNLTYISYEVGTNYKTPQIETYKSGTVRFTEQKILYTGAPDCEFIRFQVPHFDGSKFYVELDFYAFDQSSGYYDSYQSSVNIEFDI